MAEKTIKTIFILKHGTQFQFESNHIVLRDGEPSYTTDTHIFKIGDGETEWENLPVISDVNVISEEMADSLF
mgnify:CR=1 FL=1